MAGFRPSPTPPSSLVTLGIVMSATRVSSDVHDALVRRSFAELTFMREFGQNRTDSRGDLYGDHPSTLYFSRATQTVFRRKCTAILGLLAPLN
ncbi:hypothetical protein F4819DRAFT_482675 [Hypoxylon fuscum]|nr:hypothetical protein F4819DRAFT_482675 [Hypoxylon fuscum]